MVPDDDLDEMINITAADFHDPASGVVVALDSRGAWVDFGWKFESLIAFADWSNDGSLPRIGDKIWVMVDDAHDVDDRPLKVKRVHATVTPYWEVRIDHFKVDHVYMGQIVRRICGGFLVNIGVNAFLPDECASPGKLDDPSALVGLEATCRVTLVDVERRRVTVSLDCV